MVFLPVPILCARLAVTNAFKNGDSFLFAEKPRVNRRIWKEKQDDDPDENSEPS